MEQRLGFIRDSMDLKVLILYILRKIPKPINYDALLDVTLHCDQGIGYFELSQCIAELVSTEHIAFSDGLYSITEKGIANGEVTQSGLPYSVRLRADKAAEELSKYMERDSMIVTEHELRQNGGFTVKLSMSDGIGKVISMELLIGDDKQAKLMEKNFRKNAEDVYSKLVNILLEEE